LYNSYIAAAITNNCLPTTATGGVAQALSMQGFAGITIIYAWICAIIVVLFGVMTAESAWRRRGRQARAGEAQEAADLRVQLKELQSGGAGGGGGGGGNEDNAKDVHKDNVPLSPRSRHKPASDRIPRDAATTPAQAWVGGGDGATLDNDNDPEDALPPVLTLTRKLSMMSDDFRPPCEDMFRTQVNIYAPTQLVNYCIVGL